MRGSGRTGSGRRRRTLAGFAALAVIIGVLAGCSGSPILANPPVVRVQPPATPSPIEHPMDPQPIVFPRDDGPHDRLTEWWYYTGHLRDATGHRYGFEYVIFRAERGALPVTWASHLAITDETGHRFVYAQRSEIGPQVDHSPRSTGGTPAGFGLAIAGFDPTRPMPSGLAAWTMTGANGRDALSAAASPAEASRTPSPAGFGLELSVSSLKPPALHGSGGWIDFGPAGGSYYYSRTRMAAKGSLELDGRKIAVEGTAWFDHQWGDFIAVGGGGWDWFAIELSDGTDITISLVRSLDGSYPLVYGTLVRPDGTAQHLDRSAFSVEVTDHWTSPKSGVRYPAGWQIRLPAERLTIGLRPTVPDQELDTRATTGVVYWEGSQVVESPQSDRPVAGEAYVELTGYSASR